MTMNKGDLLLCADMNAGRELTYNGIYVSEGPYDTGDRTRPGVSVRNDVRIVKAWYCTVFINLSTICSEEEIESVKEKIESIKELTGRQTL